MYSNWGGLHNDILAKWHLLEHDLKKYFSRKANVDFMLAVRDIFKKPDIEENNLKKIADRHNIKDHGKKFTDLMDILDIYKSLIKNLKRLPDSEKSEEEKKINKHVTDLHKFSKEDRFSIFSLKAAHIALFNDTRQETRLKRKKLGELIQYQKNKIDFIDNNRRHFHNCSSIINICIHYASISKENAAVIIDLYDKMINKNSNVNQFKKRLLSDLKTFKIPEKQIHELWNDLQFDLQKIVSDIYSPENMKKEMKNDIKSLKNPDIKANFILVHKFKKLIAAIKGLDDDHLKDIFGNEASQLRDYIILQLPNHISNSHIKKQRSTQLPLITETVLESFFSHSNARISSNATKSSIDKALDIKITLQPNEQEQLNSFRKAYNTLNGNNNSLVFEYQILLHKINEFRNNIGLANSDEITRHPFST